MWLVPSSSLGTNTRRSAFQMPRLCCKVWQRTEARKQSKNDNYCVWTWNTFCQNIPNKSPILEPRGSIFNVFLRLGFQFCCRFETWSTLCCLRGPCWNHRSILGRLSDELRSALPPNWCPRGPRDVPGKSQRGPRDVSRGRKMLKQRKLRHLDFERPYNGLTAFSPCGEPGARPKGTKM